MDTASKKQTVVPSTERVFEALATIAALSRFQGPIPHLMQPIGAAVHPTRFGAATDRRARDDEIGVEFASNRVWRGAGPLSRIRLISFRPPGAELVLRTSCPHFL